MSDSDIFEETSNPLDSVEDLLLSHDWIFRRTHNDELVVDVKGRACNYHMLFVWQDEYSAMQFICQYDFSVSDKNEKLLPSILMDMNSDLWLGNFDIDRETGVPIFRYNSLFRGMTRTSGADHIEDIIEIALGECERYHCVFDLLASSEETNDADIKLALMGVAGES